MSGENLLSNSILAAIHRGVDSALDAALTQFGCVAGAVHWLNNDGILELAAQRNLPPLIVEIVRLVPVGKGIAGLAAERREPISICNLQTDDSGQARPAAKTTGMEGSVAVPMLVGGELRGVLGIAKPAAHDWSDEEKALLSAIAAELGKQRP